jgi:hypothetical protein
MPRRGGPHAQRLSAHARRRVEGGSTLGLWGNGPENAEAPCKLLGFSIPQCWVSFPNVIGATLGTNNVRKDRGIRDFPKVPMLRGRSTPLPARGPEQAALPGFGPDAGDPFRFTWHNTRIGAAVWIEHRGRWRAGVAVGLGRKRAAVAIEAAGFKRLIVAKSYNRLRRRR